MAAYQDRFSLQRGAKASTHPRQRVSASRGLKRLTLTRSLALGLAALGVGAVLAPVDHGLVAGNQPGTLNYAGPKPGDYRLGPRDKVRVRVFEWRPSRDEIYAWEALNAEYSIGVGGQIALPLIGEIPANGKTTAELSADISVLLQQRLGTVTAPDTTVEVIEHRPFYITGDVTTPGEYAFRPGLTVLQAVSLGGGLRRTVSTEGLMAMRDMLESSGSMSLLEQERIALIMQHARLLAEIEGRAAIETPEALKPIENVPAVAAALRNERLLFATRKSTFQTQLRTLNELKAHLEGESNALVRQVETSKEQVELIQQELAGLARLSARGLTTQSRLLGLRRTLAQTKGEQIQLEARQSKVRSDITQAEVTKLSLIRQRSEEGTQALKETMAQLDTVERKITSAKRVFGHSRQVAATGYGMAGPNGSRPKPAFEIVRRIDERVIQMAADENTRLIPGDTLKVTYELPPLSPEDAAPMAGSVQRNTAIAPQAEQMSVQMAPALEPETTAAAKASVAARNVAPVRAAALPAPRSLPAASDPGVATTAVAGTSATKPAVAPIHTSAFGKTSLPLPPGATDTSGPVEADSTADVAPQTAAVLPSATAPTTGVRSGDVNATAVEQIAKTAEASVASKAGLMPLPPRKKRLIPQQNPRRSQSVAARERPSVAN